MTTFYVFRYQQGILGVLGKNLLKVGCVLTFTDYLRQEIDTLILQSLDNEINIFLATSMIAILYFIGHMVHSATIIAYKVFRGHRRILKRIDK